MTFLPPKNKINYFIQFLFFEILNVFHDFDNQNLIIVMYFGSFFNASNTGTSSYFKGGIFGSNSGWTFTNLQTNAPRVSNEITLRRQKKTWLKTIISKFFWICLRFAFDIAIRQRDLKAVYLMFWGSQQKQCQA